jgi:Tfp pilus assembly protein PilE
MNLNQNELGRSMVEMLGVLAVIGVLSVGGITGYTYSINKHRANELVDRQQFMCRP